MANNSIVLTEIRHIKKHWEPIRLQLIAQFNKRLYLAESWEKDIIYKYVEYNANLPISITDYSNQQILEIFNFFSQYDCPYLHKNTLITTSGTNVSEAMNILSSILNGKSITIS